MANVKFGIRLTFEDSWSSGLLPFSTEALPDLVIHNVFTRIIRS